MVLMHKGLVLVILPFNVHVIWAQASGSDAKGFYFMSEYPVPASTLSQGAVKLFGVNFKV